MALVRDMKRIVLDRAIDHSEVAATYSVVTDRGGERLLQVDTYGSPDRQFPGKKSQSIRFSRSAMLQLREIIDREL